MELAKRDCRDYLYAAANIHQDASDTQIQALNKPAGMLIVVIEFLKSRSKAGMIEDSIELLSRLAGIRSWP